MTPERIEEMRACDVRSECRHYSGYKPCGKEDCCLEGGPVRPRGHEILIIKLGAMGDVLRSKSLLSGLKRKYPTSWITWITDPGSEAIIKDPRVDQILPMNAAGVLALEGRRFHALFCFDKEPHALALSQKIHAASKYGYAPTEFNTLTIWNNGSTHALRMGLSDDFKFRQNTLSHQQILYSMAELEYQEDCYDLTVSDVAKADAERIVARIGLDTSRPVVGLNTGCGPAFETKAWNAEAFAQLADLIAERTDAVTLLLGGKREREIHETIQAQVKVQDRLFDAGTENSLEVFFAVTDLCNVVVSSDSLAMHVGIALRKKVVAFFGPTCEQEVDLYSRGEKIVTDYECSPCYLKRCDVRPSCMQAMTAEDVFAVVERQLNAQQSAVS